MKRHIAVLVATILVVTVSAQINEIKRIPKGSNGFMASVYDRDAGFWAAAECSAGYSLQSRNNAGFGEIDVTFGYRFNEYFRVGPGFGLRYYYPSDHLRVRSYRWAFPMYLNLRGNLLSMRYRNMVPFYSLDLGGTVQDGLMWRPSMGVRIGDYRKAFIISVSYVGQDILDYIIKETTSDAVDKGSRYVSFLAMRLGYEF